MGEAREFHETMVADTHPYLRLPFVVANFLRRYHAFLRILVQSLRNGIFWEWEKFLSHFFCSATDLPVLASVEDGPCHLPGVALEHVCLLGTTIQETESLKIRGN